ncbi:MAG TPA: discoidin domain-containing protein, partial [Flavobacteriales bacterium]|nr:discoidin domain-containing protein [Flavobacteriales bacterium]
KSLYQVTIRPVQGPKPGEIAVGMSLASGGSFSMTEMAPPYDENMAGLEVYAGPVIINSDRELHGWLQYEGFTGPISKRRFLFNKATAQKITTDPPPAERYNEGGPFTLVDGITAQEKRVSTEWLGWLKPVTITVDLGSEQAISHIGIGALNETYSWIHLPKQVDFSTSSNGTDFTPLGTSKVEPVMGRNAFAIDKSTKARYVRIAVKHPGAIPEGFPGAGKQSWLFLDEIDVH